MLANDGSAIELVNNTITQNRPVPAFYPNSSGGGLAVMLNATVESVNNIIYNNCAFADSEVYVESGSYTVDYTCCSQPFSGVGNITDNPMFVEPGNDDFYLQTGSPCIDSGDPNSPVDPDSTRADMGALYHDQTTGVSDGEPTIHVSGYRLYPAYPNPFNPEAHLYFDIPKSGHVSLIVYDVQGREVARITDSWYDAGSYQTTFNGIDLPSGVYFARFMVKDFQQTQKLLLLK